MIKLREKNNENIDKLKNDLYLYFEYYLDNKFEEKVPYLAEDNIPNFAVKKPIEYWTSEEIIELYRARKDYIDIIVKHLLKIKE